MRSLYPKRCGGGLQASQNKLGSTGAVPSAFGATLRAGRTGARQVGQLGARRSHRSKHRSQNRFLQQGSSTAGGGRLRANGEAGPVVASPQQGQAGPASPRSPLPPPLPRPPPSPSPSSPSPSGANSGSVQMGQQGSSSPSPPPSPLLNPRGALRETYRPYRAPRRDASRRAHHSAAARRWTVRAATAR